MASLTAKYDYLEKMARKICVSQHQEPKKKPYVPFKGSGVSDSASSKKKKNKQKQTKGDNISTNKRPVQKTLPAAPPTQKKMVQNGNSETQKKPGAGTSKEFNAVDILRQRLHQKIEETRGQGPPKDPSSEEVKRKREKRKQERERRKRKRKEFRMKKLEESAALQAGEEENDMKTEMPEPKADATSSKTFKKEQTSIVFNKVEVGEVYVDKGTKLMQKKKKRKVKGTLTPLTGRNYKQLLTRVEARKAHLEQLWEKDEGKAKKEEEKMRWTNVLYKAEGMKIKDNEDLLRASLKRKEKMKAQRKKKWAERSQQVVEKMQKRQDKRRKNIQKRIKSKIDKRKDRARKKGCVLPEDLKKANI